MNSVINFGNRKMVVADAAMEGTLKLASKVAVSPVPILLCGESGTGKELIARFIHEKSRVSSGPFVSINCAAIPDGLLEAELFGYERGSFTGAVAQRIGKFERANRGTLLLDEISEMPIQLQAKLLRVLQEGEIDRLGGGAPIKINTRIIATTNRDPVVLIREKRFREDLFYRLNVFQIECQKLRNRSAAILNLAERFVEQACIANDFESIVILESARQKLISYSWPGNIRELQNLMERAVLICDGRSIDASHIRGMRTLEQQEPAGESQIIKLSDLERKHIFRILEKTAGNRTVAAEMLGISVRTLRNKLKIYAATG